MMGTEGIHFIDIRFHICRTAQSFPVLNLLLHGFLSKQILLIGTMYRNASIKCPGAYKILNCTGGCFYELGRGRLFIQMDLGAIQNQ